MGSGRCAQPGESRALCTHESWCVCPSPSQAPEPQVSVNAELEVTLKGQRDSQEWDMSTVMG